MQYEFCSVYDHTCGLNVCRSTKQGAVRIFALRTVSQRSPTSAIRVTTSGPMCSAYPELPICNTDDQLVLVLPLLIPTFVLELRLKPLIRI